MNWANWIGIGSIMGFIAVACGAFGAHGLKDRLDPQEMAIFETAARYQMFHALALLAVGLLSLRFESVWTTAAGWCFCVGILLFSGSLYVLVFSGIRGLGAITPLGGLGFLGGWLCLAVAAFRISFA